MDSKKDAVNIGVTLSGQLISAALSMLAIVGAIVFFMLDKRIVPWYFYLTIGFGFLAFIVSIFNGAKGIDKVRKDGFQDNWNLSNTKSYFNNQAIFCLIGIIASVSSVFIGESKDNVLEKELIDLNITLNKVLENNDSIYNSQIESLKEEIKKVRAEIEILKSRNVKSP